MIDITRLLCGSTTANEHLRYRRGIQKDRRPVVVWNTTRRCNLRCVHCYAHAQAGPAPGELGTDHALALIDDLAAFGVPVAMWLFFEMWTGIEDIEATLRANQTVIAVHENRLDEDECRIALLEEDRR